MSKSKEHSHLRFQAVVIASQLADKTAEALLVLDYARRTAAGFLDDFPRISSNLFPAPLKDRRACATGLPSSDCMAEMARLSRGGTLDLPISPKVILWGRGHSRTLPAFVGLPGNFP